MGLDDLFDRAQAKKQLRSDYAREPQVPQSMKIAKGAMDKAHAICKLVKEANGNSASEWYGYLIARADSPEIVRDLYLPEQASGAAHTSLMGAMVAVAPHNVEAEFGKQYAIVGWIHSHADFSTFFSSVDENNMLTVLNGVQMNTRQLGWRPWEIIQGNSILEKGAKGELIVSGALETDPKIVLPKDLAAKLLAANLTQAEIKNLYQCLQPVFVGFSYSIVVNDAGHKRADVTYIEWLPKESRFSAPWKKENAEVEVLEGEQHGLLIDEDALLQEIRRKVRFPAKYAPWQWHKYAGDAARRIEAVPNSETIAMPQEKNNLPITYQQTLDFLTAVVCYATLTNASQFTSFVWDMLRVQLEVGAEKMADKAITEKALLRLTTLDEDVTASSEDCIKTTIIDPAIVHLMTEAARHDNAFARLVAEFGRGAISRKLAIDNYMSAKAAAADKTEGANSGVAVRNSRK